MYLGVYLPPPEHSELVTLTPWQARRVHFPRQSHAALDEAAAAAAVRYLDGWFPREKAKADLTGQRRRRRSREEKIQSRMQAAGGHRADELAPGEREGGDHRRRSGRASSCWASSSLARLVVYMYYIPLFYFFYFLFPFLPLPSFAFPLLPARVSDMRVKHGTAAANPSPSLAFQRPSETTIASHHPPRKFMARPPARRPFQSPLSAFFCSRFVGCMKEACWLSCSSFSSSRC